MALNVDKNRQVAGYTTTPSAPAKAEQPAVSSQQSIFSSGSSSNSGIYTVKKGDSLWKLAKEQLIAAGNPNPSNAQIIEAMNKIAQANGCSSVEECSKKFFYQIGNELNLQGLFGNPKPEPVVEETPIEPETPVLSEQETKIKEELKSKFPDLKLENMTDSEVKTFLDNLKETNPELLSALESTVSTRGAEEVASTEEASEQPQTTSLTEEQTTVLQEQLTQYISEHPEVVTERSTTPQQSVAKSEMEQLAEKTGIEGDIDEVIATLKAKDKSELSADEARLLSLYDAKVAQQKDIDNLAQIAKEMVSSGMLDKSPQEQMETVLDKYLTKTEGEKYTSLSPKEKKEYLNQKIKVLTSIVQDNSAGTTVASVTEQKRAALNAMMVLGITEQKGLSLEQIQNMPKSERDSMIKEAKNKTIKTIIAGISDKVGASSNNGSYEKKVDSYAGAILEYIDDEYNKISDPAKKAEYRENKIKEFAIKQLGYSETQVNNMFNYPKLKEAVLSEVGITMEAIVSKAQDGDIVGAMENYKNEPLADRLNTKLQFLEMQYEKHPSEHLDSLIHKTRMEKMVYDNSPKYGIDEIKTEQDFIIATERMLQDENSGLTLEEKQMFKKMIERKTLLLQYCPDAASDNHEMDVSNAERASQYNQSLKQGYDDEFGGMTDDNVDEFDENLKRWFNTPDINEIEAFKQFAKEYGLSQETINGIVRKYADPKLTAKTAAYAKNAQDIATVTNTGAMSENEKCHEVLQNVYGTIADREGFNDNESLITIGKVGANYEFLHDSFTKGLIKYKEKEDVSSIICNINNSGEVSDAGLAGLNQSLVTNAPSDEDKLFYGQYISENTNNAAALEGLAAASRSISNARIRNLYNSHVTNAAQSLPPSSQSAINTAIKTGKISNTTLSQTTPPASSSSNTHSSSGNNSNPRTSGSSNSHSTTQTQSQTQNYSQPQQTTYNYNTPTTNTYTNPQTSTTSSVKKSSLASPSLSQADVARVAASNEAKRQQAMEHAKETAQTIDEAVEDWNKKHAKKLSVEDIDTVKAAAAVEAAREAVESSATSESEKERILTALYNATSIGEVYNILVEALGVTRVQDKFIEILASSGSTSNIKAFVASRAGDSDSLVKQLFLRTSSTSLKKELLGMLSSDTVAELLANKQITDLTSVDQRILINYVMKNIHLMSNTEFAKFLNAIADPVEKNKLIEIRTGVSQMRSRKPKTDAVQAKSETSEIETTTTSEAPTVQPTPQAYSFMQETKQAPTAESATAPAQPEEPITTAQPKLGSGEISRDLGDGTILTREGAGFGAISNTDFDLTRVVQKPKHKDGAPIGMEDETLTVGSAEWNKKYNKNNVQTTAFTLASLEEEFGDEDFGGIWGGTSGNFKGKKPDKKLHRGLKFNA